MANILAVYSVKKSNKINNNKEINKIKKLYF